MSNLASVVTGAPPPSVLSSISAFADQLMGRLPTWISRQFKGSTIRSYSALDPDGLVLIICSAVVVGIIVLRIVMALFFGEVVTKARTQSDTSRKEVAFRIQKAKEDLEKRYSEMKASALDIRDYFDTIKLKEELRVHSARQGFILQMLSPAYLSRLGFSLLFFAVASYLNTLAAVIAGWRTPNVLILSMDGDDSGVKTLPDLGHDAFKFFMSYLYGDTEYIDWFELPDFFIGTVGLIMMVFSLSHPKRLLIIRRVTFIFGYINCLRCITVVLTSLPDASPMCISQFGDPVRGAYKTEPMFPKAFGRALKVLMNPSSHITCGDMIFSGHTVFLVLCAMIFHEYSHPQQLSTPFLRLFPIMYKVKYLVYMLVFSGVFAIIGTRLHYSLDVFLAIYITIHSWRSYHSHLGKDGRLKEITWSILMWLEHDDVNHVDYSAYIFANKWKTIPKDGRTPTLSPSSSRGNLREMEGKDDKSRRKKE